MYERFTDRSRKVMQLSNQEAQRLNNEYIGTEHILLGLIKEGGGVAAQVLTSLGINMHNVLLELEEQVPSGPPTVFMGKLPQTPRTKKVIEYAMEEARKLNHNYIGTEHILLGLLRENEGIAAKILKNLDLNTQKIIDETNKLLGVDIPKRIDQESVERIDQEFVKQISKLLINKDKKSVNKIIDLVSLYSKGMIVSNELIYKIKDIVDEYPPIPKE